MNKFKKNTSLDEVTTDFSKYIEKLNELKQTFVDYNNYTDDPPQELKEKVLNTYNNVVCSHLLLFDDYECNFVGVFLLLILQNRQRLGSHKMLFENIVRYKPYKEDNKYYNLSIYVAFAKAFVTQLIEVAESLIKNASSSMLDLFDIDSNSVNLKAKIELN